MKTESEKQELEMARSHVEDAARVQWLEENPMLIGITSTGIWQAAYQNDSALGRGIQGKTWREVVDAARRISKI